METPSSSTRRVTRSQTMAAKKREESEKKGSQIRSAMIDISNDSSPIVGLTMESLEAPLSTMSKKMVNGQTKHNKTPGSGEALLRGQIKNLLQKVEEEAELFKFSMNQNPSLTPQMIDGKKEEKDESDEGMVVTRSLLSDFSEKLEAAADSSSERSSIWSIQVNAACMGDNEDEKSVDDDVECEDYNEEEDEEDADDGGLVDQLCDGMGKMSVFAEFAGKHTRFLYNSDGEFEGVEEDMSIGDDRVGVRTRDILLTSSHSYLMGEKN